MAALFRTTTSRRSLLSRSASRGGRVIGHHGQRQGEDSGQGGHSCNRVSAAPSRPTNATGLLTSPQDPRGPHVCIVLLRRKEFWTSPVPNRRCHREHFRVAQARDAAVICARHHTHTVSSLPASSWRTVAPFRAALVLLNGLIGKFFPGQDNRPPNCRRRQWAAVDIAAQHILRGYCPSSRVGVLPPSVHWLDCQNASGKCLIEAKMQEILIFHLHRTHWMGGSGRQFTSFGGCDGTKCRPAALVPTDWAAAQGGRGRQFEDSGRQLWELCDTVGGS
ncbi:hypothetical protein C8F01DRAFT_330939 [Mycena amicta]|nr:hypothetical protein C8F01DRAFT_330939 [Mycena amicta]